MEEYYKCFTKLSGKVPLMKSILCGNRFFIHLPNLDLSEAYSYAYPRLKIKRIY